MSLDLRLPPPKRSPIANAALKIAAFGALVAVYSAVLVRMRAVEAFPGFVSFAAGLALAALSVLVGVVALGVVWRSGRKGGARSLLAIMIGLATLGGPAYVAAKAFGAKQFDDVSTDLSDPPRFERAGNDRGGSVPPPPAAISAQQAADQRAAFPEIAPLKLELSPDEVSSLAAGLVDDRGWRVIGRVAFPRGGPATGRFEAVARSRFLGLDEDVMIRIRPNGDGSIVDMRSTSRVGGIDFGSNAERIKTFLGDLATAAGTTP